MGTVVAYDSAHSPWMMSIELVVILVRKAIGEAIGLPVGDEIWWEMASCSQSSYTVIDHVTQYTTRHIKELHSPNVPAADFLVGILFNIGWYNC